MDQDNQDNRVQFDEVHRPQMWEYNSRPTGMAGWIIKHSAGLIKEEKQANYFLLALSAAVIIVSVILLVLNNRPQEVIDITNARPRNF